MVTRVLLNLFKDIIDRAALVAESGLDVARGRFQAGGARSTFRGQFSQVGGVGAGDAKWAR